MKSLLAIGVALLAATPAMADVSHKITSSVQLTVDNAASQATRIGSSYSLSGNNITLSTAGNLGSLTPGSAVGYTPAAYSVTNAGQAFSFSQSFTEGDATPSATTVSNGVIGSIPMLGNTTTTSGGVAGSLAGTINTAGTTTITAGGAGTTAIGQVVVELSTY